MGDLDKDTALDGSDGVFRAVLSNDWEIWGPQGGYSATVAIRAAGLVTELRRPASFYCHYLNVPEFGEVELKVESLRRSRRAEALRVLMHQKGKLQMEALVWVTDHLQGMDHVDAKMPEVPGPSSVKSWAEWFPEGEPPFRFWYNLEGRPVGWSPEMDSTPGKPFSQTWMRFLPTSSFEDPFLEAGRLLITADVSMFPAAVRAHGGPPKYVAPSMDLAVTFHDLPKQQDWLLVEASAPVAGESLVGGNARVWSEDGRLLVSALQQMLQRIPGA